MELTSYGQIEDYMSGLAMRELPTNLEFTITLKHDDFVRFIDTLQSPLIAGPEWWNVATLTVRILTGHTIIIKKKDETKQSN